MGSIQVCLSHRVTVRLGRSWHPTRRPRSSGPRSTHWLRRPLTTTRTNGPAVASSASPPGLPRRSKFQAYLALTRFHAPVGSILLFLPCAQSTLLAATQQHMSPVQTVPLLLLFGTGAFVMRSAGCVINDLWDRDLDQKVTRTASRPIASRELSVKEGLVFLGGLLSIGLGVLTQLNMYSIVLGAASMGLVIVYPLMKRVTYVPQLVLGLAFNWGALLGYPALVGFQDWNAVLPLYASGVFWTLIYDTIYAHQDVKDDKQVGIKSTALLFGDSTHKALAALTVCQFGSLAYLGVGYELGAGFWLGTTSAFLYTLRMIYLLDIHDVKGCGDWFRKSQFIGWLIAAGLGLEYVDSLVSEHDIESGKTTASMATA